MMSLGGNLRHLLFEKETDTISVISVGILNSESEECVCVICMEYCVCLHQQTSAH